VSLVGAGPGDPELLTLRAARRLREADVVYHDALVGRAVLRECRPGARIVSVGKRRGRAALPQEAIEGALVRDASAGLRVVRLKGGDPFVFGRGGEEALTLLRAGIPFEVVPGVTSGVAVPALAGIPLTHRDLASSAAFVTAHDLSDGPGGDAARRRLRHLAKGADTIVVFMAGAHVDRVGRALVEGGLAKDTPAAVLESGTLQEQRVRRGVVGRLGDLGIGIGGGPVLIVVGRTVALAAALSGDAPDDAEAAAEIERLLGERPAAAAARPGRRLE
jgi:uroporphyrin-III C-methyltransferase